MRRSSRSPTPTKHTRNTPLNEPKSPMRVIPNDKVKIYVRLRPSLNEEQWNHNLIVCDQNTIKYVKSDLDTTYMKFDKIFTAKLQQADIFHNIESSIQGFLQGENHSFFAYGQTGAGKTYTMIGDFEESNPTMTSEHRGILARSLEKITQHLRTNRKKCTLQGSFFEVYNEKVYDLLDPRPSSKKEGLGLRESKDGANQIVDLLKFEIRSVDDALQCLRVGLKNRVIGCSHANTKSSRSHAIFQLILTQEDEANPNKKITSKLRIVDLAGSEKFIIPKELAAEEKELHILELTSINGSLSTLGHCITALAEPNRTHIPFRNSKLTRVLSDSLSGESKISFIVCLSPSLESAQESLSTLQFASRAKKIVLDGRQIKKKEEALRNNTKVLNKSNKVMELFKQLCLDPALVNTMFDPSILNKIQALENEIKELKANNKELQSQVSDLRRSCSPDPYSRSFCTPYEKDEKRCISTEPTPFDEDDKQLSYNSMNKKGFVSQSSAAIPTMNRRAAEVYPEHEGEEQESSLFRGMEQQGRRLESDEVKKIKEQRANYLKFWSDTEMESENSQDGSADRSSVMDIIAGRGSNGNTLAQKLKEKEIEKKYEMFFSMDNSKVQSSRSRTSDNSTTAQNNNILGGLKETSIAKNGEQGSKLNREGLWYQDTGDSRVNQSRDIRPVEDYVPYTFQDQDEENNKKLEQSETAGLRTDSNYDSTGLDIIKEFDRKLMSVHQLNEQHQELIKNIGLKFKGFQQSRNNKQGRMSNFQSNAGDSQFDSVKSQENSPKKLSKSGSGRDITQVVKDIKQELSEALSQIEYLKKGKLDSSSENVLTQQDTNVETWAGQTMDKCNSQSGRSMERYTWDSRQTNDDKGMKYSANQKSGKSIDDIVKKHWSKYKENIK